MVRASAREAAAVRAAGGIARPNGAHAPKVAGVPCDWCTRRGVWVRPDGDVYDADAEKKAKEAAKKAAQRARKRDDDTITTSRDAERVTDAELRASTRVETMAGTNWRQLFRKDGAFRRWQSTAAAGHDEWEHFNAGPWQRQLGQERRCRSAPRVRLSAAEKRERWITPAERAAMGRLRPNFLDRMPCRCRATPSHHFCCVACMSLHACGCVLDRVWAWLAYGCTGYC